MLQAGFLFVLLFDVLSLLCVMRVSCSLLLMLHIMRLAFCSDLLRAYTDSRLGVGLLQSF